MNVVIGPIWKSAAFWIMVVAAGVQIGVGLGYQLETEMLASVAATVIGYLVARGIIVKAAIQAAASSATYGLGRAVSPSESYAEPRDLQINE